MSSLVVTDHKGALGPAMTLIYNAGSYRPKAVRKISGLLKKNYMAVSGFKPTGRKEFCQWVNEKNYSEQTISAADIIGTRFFQSMQAQNPNLEIYAKIQSAILPKCIGYYKERFCELDEQNEKILGVWLAFFLQSFMSEESVEKSYRQKDNSNAEFDAQRQKIGTELYEAASVKQLSEDDFDTMMEIMKFAEKSCKKNAGQINSAQVYKFTGNYLQLFGTSNSPTTSSEELINKLIQFFKGKFFRENEANAEKSSS